VFPPKFTPLRFSLPAHILGCGKMCCNRSHKNLLFVLQNDLFYFGYSPAIYEGVPLALMKCGSVEGECSHVGSVEPDESVEGIVEAVRGEDGVGADVQADTAQSLGQLKLKSGGWTKRYGLFLQKNSVSL
jgi:hypothetical protein